MKKMQIQIFSDLHQEFYKNPSLIPPKADYLFLAGDINKINHDTFKVFFDYCSTNWKKVFYVLGNHEYYHSKKTFDKLNIEYHEFFKNYDNIHLLDNNTYDLNDDVRIIGSTLWSYPTSNYNLNDFKNIQIKNSDNTRTINMTLEKFQNLHLDSVNFLLSEINKKDKKLIVMTHFPPTQYNTSHPQYKNQIQNLKDYFASEMIEDIPDDHKIVSWIYGHTHYSNLINHPKKVKLISNQMGYINEIIECNMSDNGLHDIILEY